MTKFKDVAHFYLGCLVMHKHNKVTFVSYDTEQQLASVDYGLVDSKYVICGINEIKPILRSIRDIEDTEMIEINRVVSCIDTNHENELIRGLGFTAYILLEKKVDLFGLIDRDQAIRLAEL